MESISSDTDVVELELISAGDRELWYAEGGDGDGAWMLPLFVDFKTERRSGKSYGMIYPAVVPYHKQDLLLKAFFEIHDFFENKKRHRWLIRSEVVGALLKKAPGITVRRYYKWPKEDAYQNPIEHTRLTMPGTRAHADHVKQRNGEARGLISRIAEEVCVPTSVVQIVMDGLSKVATHYLVGERKVMDLGFCKLAALPYRGNWKEIVLAKLEGKGTLKKIDGDAGANIGPEAVCSPQNIAWREDHLSYTIEALPSKEFDRKALSAERERRRLGEAAYVRSFEKTIKALYDYIVEILKTHRRKVRLPFARISESSGSGVVGFVPSRGHLGKGEVDPRRVPAYILPPDRGFSALAEQGEERRVRPEIAPVPELPDIQQSAYDVRRREEKRDVEEPSNGQRGDSWLPLSDAGEGAAAGEPVLSESEARSLIGKIAGLAG